MTKLNTGWKHWDKYLAQFIGKKINIMEIGVYKGDATTWFLKNIMTNPDSRIVAVDTFGGSPEYGSTIDFTKIEKKFYENIKKTGRENQVIVMKMYSSQALINLLHTMDMNFDIIFIDASHEAKDVLSDNVLAWGLLKPGGVLINDDYKWDKLNKNYFRPKIAIDSFISSFKPEINILHEGYQMIIQKRELNDIERPIQEEIKNITDMIIQFHHMMKYSCEIKLCNKKEKVKIGFITSSKSEGNKNERLIKNMMKLRDEYRSKYLLNYFLLAGKSIYSNSNNSNKKKYIDQYDKMYKENFKNQQNNLIEFLYKYINTNEKITFLNCDPSNKYNDLLTKRFKLIHKDNIYISIYKGNNQLVKKSKNTILIKSDLLSTEDILFVSKNIGKKIKYLMLSNSTHMSLSDRIKIEETYHKRALYTLLLALTLQEKGGSLFLLLMTFEERITNDILYLLSCYYDSVIITRTENVSPLSLGVHVICEGFKDIPKKELTQLYTEMKRCENVPYITRIITNRYKTTNCAKLHIEYLETLYKEMNKIHKKIEKLNDNEKNMLKRELLPLQYSLMVKWYNKYYKY